MWLAVGMLLAILLPQQLQRHVLVGLQLLADGRLIGLRPLRPARSRRPGRSQRREQALLAPLDNLRPLQPRLLGGLQIVGDRGLANTTTQGNLALTQPQRIKSENPTNFAHGQPFLRQPGPPSVSGSPSPAGQPRTLR